MNKWKSTAGAVAAFAALGGGIAAAGPANASTPTPTATRISSPTRHVRATRQARVKTVLDRLVKDQTITAAQATAVATQVETTPHATLKADLDKLVTAKTLTAKQSKAILTALHHHRAASATPGHPLGLATNVVVTTALAKDLMMTPQALDQAIAKGITIRQLAAQHHVSMQTLRHDVRAAIKTHHTH